MGYPVVTQTWTISSNNRYTPFVSLLTAMQTYALGLKNFLKTTMLYTVKGSCSAGTGAMDGVDRWTLISDVTPRNNGSAGSQAWFVLTDGNGVDICLSFNAASDDIFRLAHSPGGNYVAAATANQQPTATDECFNSATSSWIGATASGDRIWHFWGSSDKKMFRAAIYRAQVVSSILGVEKINSDLISPATWSLAVGGGTASVYKFWHNTTGYSLSNVNGAYSATLSAADVRVHENADINIACGGDLESVYIGRPDTASVTTDEPELQGTKGNLIIPHAISTSTATAQGKVGRKYDWWFAMGANTGVPVPGAVYGGNAFIAIDNCVLWPWDSSTIPQVF